MDINNAASKGVAGTGLGLGAAGVALGLLNGGLGNLLGGWGNYGGCSENIPVNRYEMDQQKELINKDTEIAYLKGRDAAKGDAIELYRYVDGRFRGLEEQIAGQAVKNAQIEGTFAVLGEKISAQHNEFLCALNRERDERCCSDTSIVTYANATFYPKQVADISTGTTTSAQLVYNPLPCCGK